MAANNQLQEHHRLQFGRRKQSEIFLQPRMGQDAEADQQQTKRFSDRKQAEHGRDAEQTRHRQRIGFSLTGVLS